MNTQNWLGWGIMLAAASVLLSPFFYVGVRRHAGRPRAWRKVACGFVLFALVLTLAWAYF